jgi:hypothetical protein
MKVQVIQVFRIPNNDTRIIRINSGFASCYPKFPNGIRVSGYWLFCPGLILGLGDANRSAKL